jgi:iron complex outermembrane receptor protein
VKFDMSTKALGPKLSFLAKSVCLALLAATASASFAQASKVSEDGAAPVPKDDGVRLGTITIVGSGDRLGAGEMLQEDAFKGRSTVTRASTERNLPTGNFYQAMNLLPGMNSFSYDATGLFGGGLTVRGFNSDQLGVTINGVPINDSGNFAVYPMEYTDQENLCLQSIAQGNPDIESPHVGATGGSVSLITCDPEEKKRFRVAQTVGGLNLSRTFVRADTGRFANESAKAFVSYSHSEVDKWKGLGSANREHFDAGFSLDLSPDNKIVGSVLYNRAVNNNFLSLSLPQLNANGYRYDYATVFSPGKLPGGAGAQRETGPSPQYFQLSLNPFENMIASVSGSFKISPVVSLKVQPYFWYGYGTGGNQQRAQSESAFLNTSTRASTAAVDLNRDGDTLDTILIASSNVTRTMRPGVTSEFKFDLGAHQIRTGVWYERAEHRQTGPGVAITADGRSSDVWLRDGKITRPDGSLFQTRDWLTVSPAYQLYASDVFGFQGEKGELSVGVRAPHITREFTNYPSEAGGNSLNGYTFEKTFSEVLPQVGMRYNLTPSDQLFVNVGKNFRAPPNFALAPTNNAMVFVNGVPQLLGSVVAETSIMTDLGYRLQTKAFSLSATGFMVDYKNRQANAYDPILDKSIYTNAGDVSNRGIEAELGTTPVNGFSAYVSFTSQKSEVKNDLVPGKGQLLPTKGKQYPLTPETMVGLALQYSSGPFYGRLRVKQTGKQFATLVNDEEVPSYTVGGLDVGYLLGDLGFARNAQIRMNVNNLGNSKYRNPSSGTVLNASAVGGVNAGTVFYYLGAPRLISFTLSSDF